MWSEVLEFRWISVLFVRYERVVGRRIAEECFPKMGQRTSGDSASGWSGGLKSFDRPDGKDEASCCGVNLAAGLRFWVGIAGQ